MLTYKNVTHNHPSMRNLLSVLLLLIVIKANSQSICFEDFQAKIIQPLERAINDAKSDKETDSLMKESIKVLKSLEGCQMPTFEAVTMDGKPINTVSLKGKIVVFNFWFIGCAPCVAELPALNRLVEQYKGKQVVFVAFGNSTKSQTVSEFLPKHKFAYQLISDAKDYADKFVVSVWPVNMVFDQSGVLQFINSGGYTDDRAKTAAFDKLSPVIAKLLDNK